MFRILQWSDSHGQTNTLTPTQSLLKTVPNIDMCIHCGDVVPDHYPESIDSFDQSLSMCVIGNHDSIDVSGTDPTGYHWDMQASQADLYSKYFSKAKANFGVDINTNETWWSKEFKDKQILFLGINDSTIGDALNKQLAWFDEKISYAENKGLSVIVAKHGPSNYGNIEENTFTSIYAKSSNYIVDTNDYNKVYSGNDKMIGRLVRSTAKILCVLHGHEHTDYYGYIIKNDSTNIPVIGINSTLMDIYGDVLRVSNSNVTSSVCVNLIEIDNDSLYIYRLGADNCKSGVSRKMLTYSYSKNKVVSLCSV